MVYLLFLLLMMTTLVSQYAEIGSLFSAATGIPEALLRARVQFKHLVVSSGTLGHLYERHWVL